MCFFWLQLFCPFHVFSATFASLIKEQMCYVLAEITDSSSGFDIPPSLSLFLHFDSCFLHVCYTMSDKILATSNLFVQMLCSTTITANQNVVDGNHRSRNCCRLSQPWLVKAKTQIYMDEIVFSLAALLCCTGLGHGIVFFSIPEL